MATSNVSGKESTSPANTKQFAGKQNLGAHGLSIGADARFVSDGERLELTKNLAYERIDDGYVLNIKVKDADGKETTQKRKVPSYLLDRMAENVIRHGDGWYTAKKESANGKNFYSLAKSEE